MKPNKLSITTLLCCLATLFAGNVRAQSLQSLLKMFGGSKTEQKAEPKTEIPSTEQLQGRWVYNAADMIYTGDSAIASVAVASAKTQLPAVVEKSGLVAGRDYIEIGNDGTARLVLVQLSASGRPNARRDGTWRKESIVDGPSGARRRQPANNVRCGAARGRSRETFCLA